MFVWLIIVFFVDGLWLPARTTWNLDDFQENRRYYLVEEPELGEFLTCSATLNR